jgi:asparaginyl-tRNA synthetase
MIEPEIAFANLFDNAALAEALLKYTFAALLNERQEDLAFFDQRIEKGLIAKLERIVGSEFVHMDYGEAIQVLERANEKFEFPVKWGVDLQSEHERYLTEKHAKKPVIVMNYPKAIKAFYMRVNDDGRTVVAMDVLAPGIGEIIGGSQREERLEMLDRSMAEHGIDQEHCASYRETEIKRQRPAASHVRSVRAPGGCSSPPTDRCAAARSARSRGCCRIRALGSARSPPSRSGGYCIVR